MAENYSYIKSALDSNISKNIRSSLVEFIGADADKINNLWQMVIESDDPLQWRYAWVFEAVCLKNRDILVSYFDDIVSVYKSTLNTSILRMFGKLLCNVSVPEHYESLLFDVSVSYVQNEKLPVAVRVNAMQLAYNIAVNYSELKLELQNIFQLLALQNGTKGFVSRLDKLLTKLN